MGNTVTPDASDGAEQVDRTVPPVRRVRFRYGKGLMRDLAVYMQPGFQPNDVDTSDLEVKWRTELFGADGHDGEVSDRIRSAPQLAS